MRYLHKKLLGLIYASGISSGVFPMGNIYLKKFTTKLYTYTHTHTKPARTHAHTYTSSQEPHQVNSLLKQMKAIRCETPWLFS